MPDTVVLNHEEPGILCLGRQTHAFGKYVSIFGDQVAAEAAVGPQRPQNPCLGLSVAAETAGAFECRHCIFVNALRNDDGVLGGTGRGVVEGFGRADLGSRIVQIRALVDDDGHITSTDADRRSTT